ncbi:MAG: DUF4838 domain-containing protein [Promethearchaeota archaeon]
MNDSIMLKELKSILIRENYSPSEMKAAKELSRYIKDSTGFELKIHATNNEKPAGVIILGRHPSLKSLEPELYSSSIEEDEFWLKSNGDNLIIFGAAGRGTLHGAYQFLEEFLGIKFLAPDIVHVPKNKDDVKISISRKYSPAFKYRVITYLDGLDPEFSITQKINLNPFSDEETGGSYKFSPDKMTHTFYTLVPPKKYHDKHPEYFALVKGQRLKNLGQLCLSNKDVLDITTNKVLKWFEDEPDLMTVGIVQNDWAGYCECENCRKVDKGNPARSLIIFCSEVAKRVRERYPDKFIHTIAYTYTEKPPMDLKGSIPDNLIIVVCNMFPYRANRPVNGDPVNERYYNNLKGWIEIAPHVFTWHYFVDFTHYLLPFPIWKTIHSDLKIYQQLGVEGVLLQAGIGLGIYQEFQELKMYVFHKLLWNPDLDLDSLIKEFTTLYYKDAAPQILKFINELMALETRKDVFLHLYVGLEGNHLEKEWILKNMELVENTLNEAKDDEEIKKRIEKIIIMLDYAYLLLPVDYEINLGKIKPKDLKFREKILTRFKRLINKFKITSPGENAPMSAFVSRQELICKENSILALAEFAPIVYKILDTVLEKVKNSTDNSGFFEPSNFINTIVKHGLNPLELSSWISAKQIATHDPNTKDIWHYKLQLKNVETLLNPAVPNVKRKDLPKIITQMIQDLPWQKDVLED